MREFRTYGSVRGALSDSDGRPYRDQKFPCKFSAADFVANVRKFPAANNRFRAPPQCDRQRIKLRQTQQLKADTRN